VIDLHCHVLPGIDDGARDLEDSLEMARQAQADGIELICATPHIRHDHDVLVHELPGRTEALNAELAAREVRVRITPAGEVAETEVAALTDGELETVSLDGTGRWILLEPAPGPLSDTLADTVERLRERGARSVVAHPERHLGADAHERLRSLIDRGALVQATAAYLDQPPPGDGVVQLAATGLVHLLGSDAHSSRAGRAPVLSGAFRQLALLPLLAPHLEWIREDAPAAILRGEDVSSPF
jgi:protein-tyrosine phosphatase